MKIEEIKARLNATTPGEWGTPNNPIIPLLEIPYNAGFIAHAREDIEALLAEVERLQAQIVLGVIDSDLVKSYDGSALERADKYIEQLESERDAAIEDIPHWQSTCAHDWKSCGFGYPCPDCPNWKWRGRKENE